MFSDSRNYPPACIKVKCLDRVPPCVDRSWKRVEERTKARAVDVCGSHRHLFYRRPNVSALSLVVVEDEDKKEKESAQTSEVKLDDTDVEAPKSRTFGIQTDYRESETQTLPYSPDVVLGNHTEDTPLVLSFKNLKWGQGLPPGLHEIEDIEWEINHRELKAFLLDPNNVPESKRPVILEYIHREEWLHREKEIQGIHDLRLGLAEKMMHKRGEDLSDRLHEVIKRRYKKKLEENRKKIMKLRENHQRELRKLINKRKGTSMKYKRPDPITEQADYSSELYGPLMRHGVDPRRRHEVPLSLRSKFLHDYKGLQILERATELMKTPEMYPLKEKPVRDGLCTRGTRWTDEQLLLLRKYFKGLLCELEGQETKSLPRLMVPVPKPSPRPMTPDMEGAPESEEKLYQAAVFMQKIIRGRAIQMLMFKGKEKSQDLINELQTTHSVLRKEGNAIEEERIRTLLGYQNELEEKRNEEAYENMLSMLVGDTVGGMLDFLAKELVRLKDERCIHALLLLAQRERHRREAEEAGRRQVEERRRREHDEFFKQVVKVHQETVDVYLEDIVLNAMEWVATAESRSYIKELAKNIDQKTRDLEDRKNIWECKELVTELVYDYVLPEGYKDLLDQEREKEQKEYLKTIQDEVYKTLADPDRKDLQALDLEGQGEDDHFGGTSGNKITVCAIKDEMEVFIQAMHDKVFKLLGISQGTDESSPELETEDGEQRDGEEEDGEQGDEVIENDGDEEASVQEISDGGRENLLEENLETRPERIEDGDKLPPDERNLEAESNIVKEPTADEEGQAIETGDQDVTQQPQNVQDETRETVADPVKDELPSPDVELAKEEEYAENEPTEEGERKSKKVSACEIKEELNVMIQKMGLEVFSVLGISEGRDETSPELATDDGEQRDGDGQQGDGVNEINGDRQECVQESTQSEEYESNAADNSSLGGGEVS